MTWRQLLASRLAKRTGLAVAVLGLLWGACEGVTRSDWFRELIRTRLERALEGVAGGSVMAGEVQFGASRLSFRILDLEVRAAPGRPPLIAVPETSLRLSWRALLTGRAVLESLHVHSPVLRVDAGEGGPSAALSRGRVSGLHHLEIQRLVLSDGRILWNGRTFAAAFRGTGVRVDASFNPATRAYSVDAACAGLHWSLAGRSGPPVSAAALSAVVGADGIEILGAEAHGEGYDWQARGFLQSTPELRFDGDFGLTADLGLLAGWLGGLADPTWPPVAGQLQADGSLHWLPAGGSLRYTGTLRGQRISAGRAAAHAAVEAMFAGDLHGIDFPAFSGSALGGSFAGQAEIRDLGLEPRFAVKAQVSETRLDELAVASGVRNFPWSGWLGADLSASGVVGGGFEVTVQARVQPQGGVGQIPVSGLGELRYMSRAGSVEIAALQLSTPNAQLELAGTLDARGGAALEVRVGLESRQALERLLTAFRPQVALPPDTPDGRYSFLGRAVGPLGSPAEARLDGTFAVQEFLFRGQRWERLELEGELSSDRLALRSGFLADGAGRLELRGTLPLTAAGALRLKASGRGLDASKLALAGGLEIPAAGSVALDLEAQGSQSEPVVRATVAVEGPSVYGEAFERLEAQASYGPHGMELRDIRLLRGDAVLAAEATVARADGSLEFELESKRWPLEGSTWAQVVAPNLTGWVRFGLRGTAPLRGNAPLLRSIAIEGAWEFSDLRLGEVELGRWSGACRTDRRTRRVAIDWQADALAGTAHGGLVLHLDEKGGYAGTVQFEGLDPARIALLLDLPGWITGGAVAGQASFAGEAEELRSFKADGILDQFEVRAAFPEETDYVVTNVFPLRWDIADGALRLDSMSLSGPDTKLDIDGTLGLLNERRLDLAVNGSLDLQALRWLRSGLTATGQAHVGLQLRGPLVGPVLDGSVELVGAVLRGPGLPFTLSDLTGTIALRDNEARIEELTAVCGGGVIRFSGASAIRGSGLEYRMQADAASVRLDYPEGLSSVLDGSLTLAGVGYRSMLSGDLLISRMATANDFALGDLFAGFQQPEPAQAGPLLRGMQLNVQVSAVAQLPIETSLVREMEADFDLELVGPLGSPALLGTIGITKAETQMLGTNYRISRGEIRFVNPFETEPVLDIELETRIRDVDITLVLSGPGRELNLSYRSDPPLPFHELVNLVAVGKEPTVDPTLASQRRIEQQSLVQTGADNILSQALERPMSQRLQRFFGVSRLKVDPQVGGLEANPSARISTEQQLAKDLTLIYSYDLSSAQQQAVRIEWTPTRRWSLIVTRDQNGLVGSDILYKVRLR